MKRTRSGRVVQSTIQPSRYDDGHPVPLPTDEIKVLWRVGSDMVWWVATVLDADSHFAPPVVATGVIRYEAYGRHKVEECEVEFLLTPGKDRLLRHKGTNTEDFDTNSWLYLSESFPTLKEAPEMVGRTATSDAASGCDASTVGPGMTSDAAGGCDVSPTKTNAPVNSTDMHIVACVPSRNVGNEGSVASLLPVAYDELPIALLEIRNELLLKLGARWSIPRKLITMTGDGLYGYTIQASVGCTLIAFQVVAKQISVLLPNDRAVCVPSFYEAQRCSISIPEIKIYVHDLQSLCIILGINDFRDFRNMLSQDTRTSSERLLLFVGAAGQKKVRDGNGTVTVNRAVLGNSVMPRNMPTVHSRSCLSPTSGSATELGVLQGGHDHVFEQPHTFYDEVVKCYHSPWRKVAIPQDEYVPFDMNVDSAGDCNVDEASTQCIYLSWKPAATPSRRRWTDDALHTGREVLGFLSLNVFVVACMGTHSIRELGRLLRDVLTTF